MKGGKMKKAFTLLELMIVIIIVGVLATLGLTQYQAVIERSRGAEARQILGALRSQCAAIYMNDGDADNCINTNLGIGTANDQIPGPALANCRDSHYFYYTAVPSATPATSATFTGTRCSAGGRAPNAPVVGRNITLTTDYSAGGTDAWGGNYGY